MVNEYVESNGFNYDVDVFNDQEYTYGKWGMIKAAMFNNIKIQRML